MDLIDFTELFSTTTVNTDEHNFSIIWRHSDPKVTIKTEAKLDICSGSVMKRATTVNDDNMKKFHTNEA